MSRSWIVAPVVACALAVSAPSARRAPAPGVAHLGIAGRSNSGVSIAASGRDVAAVWAASTDTETGIFAALSRDDGRTFGTPVRVDAAADGARVTGEQPPQIAIDGRGRITVVWESKTKAGVSRIRTAEAAIPSLTFGPARTAHAERLSGARGWASLAVGPDDRAHVVWLDGRNADLKTGGAVAGHNHGGMSSMRQDVFAAFWQPDGTRYEIPVAAGTCFCCKTAVAASADAVYVAWRHVYPVNHRDIAIARSSDGGRTFDQPVRVSDDHWVIDACPEDGPALGVTADGDVHVAWPTVVTSAGGDVKALFYSVSTNGGRAFAPRVRLDDGGGAAHPRLAARGDRVTIAWESRSDRSPRLQMRSLESIDGTPRLGPIEPVLGARGSARYPSVALTDDARIVAWSDDAGGAQGIEIARLP